MSNIVITGAGSGIGLKTALYLKNRGIVVYPTARDMDDIKMLRGYGFDALYLDVRDYKNIKDVIYYVKSKDSVIDVWFNNAGYGQIGALEDISVDLLKEQFETNVFGLFEATREVLKVMRRQRKGKIIQHSSILGLVSMPYRGAYNASKYAVEGLSDTLRLEVMDDKNIHIVTLNTGPIESNFRKNAIKTLDNIDIQRSRFANIYRMVKSGDIRRVPFTLPPTAVAEVVYKIILSKNPSPRYYITKASYLLAFAKRLLPTSILDRVLKDF